MGGRSGGLGGRGRIGTEQPAHQAADLLTGDEDIIHPPSNGPAHRMAEPRRHADKRLFRIACS